MAQLEQLAGYEELLKFEAQKFQKLRLSVGERSRGGHSTISPAIGKTPAVDSLQEPMAQLLVTSPDPKPTRQQLPVQEVLEQRKQSSPNMVQHLLSLFLFFIFISRFLTAEMVSFVAAPYDRSSSWLDQSVCYMSFTPFFLFSFAIPCTPLFWMASHFPVLTTICCRSKRETASSSATCGIQWLLRSMKFHTQPFLVWIVLVPPDL